MLTLLLIALDQHAKTCPQVKVAQLDPVLP